MDRDRLGWLGWTATGVGVITLVLVVVNIVLATGNGALQREVNARQQQINEGIRVNNASNQMVQLLAAVAARTNDAEIRALLERHGTVLAPNPQGAQPPQAAPAPAEEAKP
ncbi:MAG TPA: hypothetical protein VGB90_07110 [Alphaproteobacteria bacterium]|jgi:hypothetical protein